MSELEGRAGEVWKAVSDLFGGHSKRKHLNPDVLRDGAVRRVCQQADDMGGEIPYTIDVFVSSSDWDFYYGPPKPGYQKTIDEITTSLYKLAGPGSTYYIPKGTAITVRLHKRSMKPSGYYDVKPTYEAADGTARQEQEDSALHGAASAGRSAEPPLTSERMKQLEREFGSKDTRLGTDPLVGGSKTRVSTDPLVGGAGSPAHGEPRRGEPAWVHEPGGEGKAHAHGDADPGSERDMRTRMPQDMERKLHAQDAAPREVPSATWIEDARGTRYDVKSGDTVGVELRDYDKMPDIILPFEPDAANKLGTYSFSQIHCRLQRVKGRWEILNRGMYKTLVTYPNGQTREAPDEVKGEFTRGIPIAEGCTVAHEASSHPAFTFHDGSTRLLVDMGG